MRKLSSKIALQTPFIIFIFFLLVSLILNYLYLTDKITTSKDIDFYNIANSILLNIIAGFIFYFFISYLPQRKKHKILRNNLSRTYKQFKEEVLGLFISINKDKHSKVDDLMSLKECRAYLNDNNKERFFKIMNYLNHESESTLKKVLNEMMILKSELDYTLSVVEFDKEEVFIFIKNISRVINRLQNPNLETDDFKYLMQFLFELFTGWDFVNGYKDEDIIEMIIKNI